MSVLNKKKDFLESDDSSSINVILASNIAQRLVPLAEGLWTIAKTELYQAGTGAEVMELLEKKQMELVIIDEELKDSSGIELAQRIAREQPFVNCILISDLAAEDFHETTEGLGLLMQLNSPPAMEDSKLIVTHLEAIKASRMVS